MYHVRSILWSLHQAHLPGNITSWCSQSRSLLWASCSTTCCLVSRAAAWLPSTPSTIILRGMRRGPLHFHYNIPYLYCRGLVFSARANLKTEDFELVTDYITARFSGSTGLLQSVATGNQEVRGGEGGKSHHALPVIHVGGCGYGYCDLRCTEWQEPKWSLPLSTRWGCSVSPFSWQ